MKLNPGDGDVGIGDEDEEEEGRWFGWNEDYYYEDY